MDVIGIGNEGKRDLSGMFRIITKLTVMPCLSTQSKRKSALASSSAPNNNSILVRWLPTDRRLNDCPVTYCDHSIF